MKIGTDLAVFESCLPADPDQGELEFQPKDHSGRGVSILAVLSLVAMAYWICVHSLSANTGVGRKYHDVGQIYLI